ncbi:TetR/AcrR family transcriptional regulator [Nocardia sp. NPDC058176]|uniref:TetR/AcrR family transcriptional regulator n=1 Tax=Nocardia sp. NPDC058176 TaxID=3346368 RepID=UPI0036DD92F6
MTMTHSDIRHPVNPDAGCAAVGPAHDVRGPGLRAHRRRTAMAAAREVFVAHGYHGARMDEISALAGMSKPTLYSYFPGKLDLYLAVLQHYLDWMVAGVRDALAADVGHRERVHRAVAVYFDFVDEDAGGHVLVFESPVPSEPCVEWRVRNAMNECAVLVGAQLRAAGAAGFTADACAWGLVGASHLAARHWLDAGRPIPKNEAVDTAVALCWNGLSAVDRVSSSPTRRSA